MIRWILVGFRSISGAILMDRIEITSSGALFLLATLENQVCASLGPLNHTIEVLKMGSESVKSLDPLLLWAVRMDKAERQ